MLRAVYAVLGLLTAVHFAQCQQTIPGLNGLLYTCPTQKVSEIAFIPYCPASTKSGIPLSGEYTQRIYSGSPSTFKTLSATDQGITCHYSSPANPNFYCLYYAGGGQGFLQFDPDPDCPAVTSAPPQISPGYNYRRKRNSLAKRFDQDPQYNCPWTSNGGPVISQANIYLGDINGGGTTYTFGCLFRIDGGSNFGCTYYDRPATGITPFSGNNVNCPITVCDAVESNSPTIRRGVYDGDQRIGRAQVNTRELRERLKTAKRRDKE